MQDISIEFHKEAELEMLQAADFYEHQERGLEQRFFDEIDRGLEAISCHPTGWPVLEGSLRKKVLFGFPYTILFEKDQHRIYILAIMHQSREPGYWKSRLG